MSMVVDGMRRGDYNADGISTKRYAFTNNRTYYVDYNEYDNRFDVYYSIGRDQSIFAEYKFIKSFKIKLGLIRPEDYSVYIGEDE